MLDQLVESRESYGDGARRGGFLLTTMVLVVAVFASGMLWSLFAKDLGIGGESLEISSLVAPVVADAEPLAPEPIAKEIRREQSPKEASAIPVRNENIIRIDESPIAPTDVSTAPNKGKARPQGLFTISRNSAETDGNSSSLQNGRRGNGSSGGAGISQNVPSDLGEEVETEPPVIKKATPTPVPAKPKIQSLGVINGKATNLPKPPYPAAARSVRAQGDVSVQVTIDETGRVISARAVSGHPLLRTVSETAAQSVKFAPTLLSNQPVKVTGVIIYKFSAQ